MNLGEWKEHGSVMENAIVFMARISLVSMFGRFLRDLLEF
jgi:hypothetical protein